MNNNYFAHIRENKIMAQRLFLPSIRNRLLPVPGYIACITIRSETAKYREYQIKPIITD